jgi:HD-GYP domain-containing protein (c-di-GMP phosphodiesterase class II)
MVGIVSIARDMTEAYEHKNKMDSLSRATMSALVYTIEMHDPYLAGHSQRMGEICLAIGERLALSEDKIATLEMSANLSQIGKMSVPSEILTKNARLNPSELKQVQQHIVHAEEILKQIDFGLPVSDTVGKMHERLDGSGYPLGLEGSKIPLLGRIIAVADVYCARISPRSYRSTISSDEALQIMLNNPEKYDRNVVEALGEHLTSEV